MCINKAIMFVKDLQPVTKEKKLKKLFLRRLRRNRIALFIYSKIPHAELVISPTWKMIRKEKCQKAGAEGTEGGREGGGERETDYLLSRKGLQSPEILPIGFTFLSLRKTKRGGEKAELPLGFHI